MAKETIPRFWSEAPDVGASITKLTRLAAAMRDENELREIPGFMRAPHVMMLDSANNPEKGTRRCAGASRPLWK